jgi:hypothetical protein
MQLELFPPDREMVIEENLKLFGLPKKAGDLIKSLLLGKMREDGLICCHTECEVCFDTLANCFEKIKREL